MTLEQAALRDGVLEKGLVVGPQCLRQLDRTRRCIPLMPAETAHSHREPAQFTRDVVAPRELGDVPLPQGTPRFYEWDPTDESLPVLQVPIIPPMGGLPTPVRRLINPEDVV